MDLELWTYGAFEALKLTWTARNLEPAARSGHGLYASIAACCVEAPCLCNQAIAHRYSFLRMPRSSPP